MKIEQYKCDVCGALKGETNHWWRVVADTAVDDADTDVLIGIRIYPFSLAHTEHRSDTMVLDLCGQRCVIAKVSELMGEAR